MAYTKTQWVNNTTPINDTNLNKIEQGIYDNSLVVDAVTNTLNPTDTETYKTAELTEGQITDVIGVKDILIKGQTSQEGTPTPSAPVDVNVVSGSNVIDIQNSDTNFAKEPVLINYNVNSDGLGISNGYAVSQKIFVNNETKFYYGLNTAFSNVNDSTLRIGFFDENDNFLSRILGANIATSPIRNVTIPNNTKYIMIGASNNASNGFWREIEKVYYGFSSTIVPHQGKELPLDLPVENLLNPFISHNAGYSVTNNGVTFTLNSDGTITANGTATESSAVMMLWGSWSGTTSYLSLNPNQTYKLSEKNGGKAYLRTKTDSTYTTHSSDTNSSLIESKNDVVYFAVEVPAGKTVNNYIFKPMLEQGSKANAYTSYGTDPIELCKIGNYQDYFYKSGSKWYLHKEVGKITLNGSESGGWTLRETNTNTMRITADGLVSPGILAYSQVYSKVFKGYSSNADMSNIDIPSIAPRDTGSGFTVRFPVSIATTVDGFKTWLASNLPFVYYATSNVTNTEITNTTLISQLEAIYNAPLYEETNITQENNDLPMVLDITACKDNINGIKAFIRK